MTPVILLAILCLAVSSAAPLHDSRYNIQWQRWKVQYRKRYVSLGEERYRRAVWENNMKKIEQHNAEYRQGKHSFIMGINAFGDMSFADLQARMLNTFKLKHGKGKLFQKKMGESIPTYLDWREHGYVTPVQHQGTCNSCWAFSAVGSIEGQMFRKTGKLVPLSVQNILDCSWNQGNLGCFGGWVERAFQSVKVSGGVNSEMTYPYKGKDKLCTYDHQKSSASITGFEYVAQDEKSLMNAVATVGPISALIHGNLESFLFYKEGIYFDAKCNSTDLTHAILVVGYGSDDTKSQDKNYWLIKNSWGENWGIKGYAKLAKDQNNHCGIATHALYPNV